MPKGHPSEVFTASAQPHLAPQNDRSRDDSPRVSLLYTEYAQELVGYLRKVFGDGPPDPEDVAQTAFEKLAKTDLSQIKNVKAFLWRTARNLTLTEKRNRGVRSRYDFEVEHLFFALHGSESDPQRVLQVKQQLKIINEALRLMPERRRVAFLLHRVDGLNFAAVGRRLGVSRKMARKHVARAVIDLEDALSDSGGMLF